MESQKVDLVKGDTRMMCYSCRKYDNCELPWKCSSTMYDCSAYELEQTNEEWFCQLSTEEKADWLSKHLHCGDCDIENRECFGTYSGCKETLIKWLKEIHK